MKQLFVLFAVLLMVCSCSDEILNEDNHQAILGSTNVTFSYDSITQPSNWLAYRSFQERFDACQIPDSLLHVIPTSELIELCASHPMNGIYLASDNPNDGIRYMVNNFNGIAELKQRSDVVDEILSFYSEFDLTNVSNKPYVISITGRNGSKYNIYGFCFMELLIAANTFPQLYTNNAAERLEQISYKLYEEKLINRTLSNSLIVKSSLMVQAQIALHNRPLSTDEKATLELFLHNGGNGYSLTSVSKILYRH